MGESPQMIMGRSLDEAKPAGLSRDKLGDRSGGQAPRATILDQDREGDGTRAVEGGKAGGKSYEKKRPVAPASGDKVATEKRTKSSTEDD